MTHREATMVHHLIHFLAFVVAVMLTARVVPGIRVKSFTGALFFSIVFALLNKLLFLPLVMFTFPVVVISLGLFLILINAFLFWLAEKVVSGVEVDGFGSALFASVVVSIINWGITFLLRVVL
jgi:putative membrane protein